MRGTPAEVTQCLSLCSVLYTNRVHLAPCLVDTGGGRGEAPWRANKVTARGVIQPHPSSFPFISSAHSLALLGMEPPIFNAQSTFSPVPGGGAAPFYSDSRN